MVKENQKSRVALNKLIDGNRQKRGHVTTVFYVLEEKVQPLKNRIYDVVSNVNCFTPKKKKSLQIQYICQ